MPYRFRPGASNAAIGVEAEPPVTVAPAGGAVTESRWLIHTVCSSWRPAASAPPKRMSVLPNSEIPVRSTRPPSSWAIRCMP